MALLLEGEKLNNQKNKTMATTYFCPQLERRVCSKEFEDAKKLYIENVKIPKLSIDWKIHHIDTDLIDEVFYYAIKFGYKASKRSEEHTSGLQSH